MHIYLLRHGIAEEPALGQPDSTRRLTPEGVAKMQREARGMARLGLKWDAVFTSPYDRALETAQIVAKILHTPPLKIESGIISGAFRLGVLQGLCEPFGQEAHLLFVGHEPDMSLLTYHLTGAQIAMKKGGMAHIEAIRPEPAQGTLRWLFAPSHLALLGD